MFVQRQCRYFIKMIQNNNERSEKKATPFHSHFSLPHYFNNIVVLFFEMNLFIQKKKAPFQGLFWFRTVNAIELFL